MAIKDFFMKKMLERQLKNVPAEQRDMIMSVVEKNPDFFQKIEKEVKQLEKEGKDKNVAAFEVMRKHQGELQKILMGK